MREVCLLRTEANSMRVFWAQGLWLTVHLLATSALARPQDCHASQFLAVHCYGGAEYKQKCINVFQHSS